MGIPRGQREIKTEFYALYIEPKNLSPFKTKAHTIIRNMLIKTGVHRFEQCVVYAEILGEMLHEGTTSEVSLGERDVECKRYLLEELNYKFLADSNQEKLDHDARSIRKPGVQSFQPPDFLKDKSLVISVGSRPFLATIADMLMERQGGLTQTLIYTLGCISFLEKEGQYIPPIPLDSRYKTFDPGCIDFLQHRLSLRPRSYESIVREFSDRD